MTTRLLLAEDHTITRETWRVFLEGENDFEVVGECGDGRTAIDMARKSPPDVVVLEAVLPGLNGVEATRQISAEAPGVVVVGLSVHHDRFIGPMMRAGASAYLGKTDTAENLVEAIRQVRAGNQYVSPQFIRSFSEHMRNPQEGALSVLTPKEREVLQLIAEGRRTKEIALILVKSEPTVRSQVRSVKKKLGLRSEAALTKFAVKEGITSPDP